MYLKERAQTSDHFDQFGVNLGDLVMIYPLSGRKKQLEIKRTKIKFVSEHFKEQDGVCKTIILPHHDKERFNVEMKQADIEGRNDAKKKRFILKVISGTAIKVNGTYTLETFIEINDVVEIGFNKLVLKRESADQQGFIERLLCENEKAMNSKLPILLEGETGTGKTSLARKIHERSGRMGAFVHLNIAALANNLVESELFGHLKGSFTGASSDKKGAFHLAHGGTLFLDEIDSLSLDLQTKLLLFLDDYKFRSVGSLCDTKVDTRLIFSSGQKMKVLLEKGLIRKDFYFRLSHGVVLNLPTLRDRPELILEFCHNFMLAQKVSLSPKLMDFYCSLPWPGNFRQLKGHLERKLIFNSKTKMEFDQYDEKLIGQSSELAGIHTAIDFPTLECVKKNYMQKVYFHHNKNIVQTAKVLNISERTLRNHVDRFDTAMNRQYKEY